MLNSFLELGTKSWCSVYLSLLCTCRYGLRIFFLFCFLFFVWTHRFLCSFWCFKQLNLLFSLMFKLLQLWPMGGPKFIFYVTHNYLKAFSLWGTIKGPRIILYFTCPNQMRSVIPSRRPGSFRGEVVFRIHTLGLVHYYWVVIYFAKPFNGQS